MLAANVLLGWFNTGKRWCIGPNTKGQKMEASLSPLFSLPLPFLSSNAHINFCEDSSYETLYAMPRAPVAI